MTQQYSYYDIQSIKCNFFDELNKIQQDYVREYSEINHTTSIWKLTSLRFKYFEYGKSFDGWHSEHSIVYPNRILSLQIYLSEHNCGTLFYNGERILSKMGRVTIFLRTSLHIHIKVKFVLIIKIDLL